MSLLISINQLESCVIEIESQLIQIDNHNSNANMASAGSIAAYFLTNDSKNKTVRTVGQVAAIGGMIFSANQRSKANSIESLALLNIGKAINIIERDCKPYIRIEKNVDSIRSFLEILLRYGATIDVLLKKTISKLKWKGHLGKKNQDILLNVNHIDIINKKLRHNETLNFIDRNIRINDPAVKFTMQTKAIDKEKLRKEGIWIRASVILLLITGVILQNQNSFGQYLFIAAIALWALNHFFPIFPETKKLRSAVSDFNSELQNTIGIRSITLR